MVWECPTACLLTQFRAPIPKGLHVSSSKNHGEWYDPVWVACFRLSFCVIDIRPFQGLDLSRNLFGYGTAQEDDQNHKISRSCASPIPKGLHISSKENCREWYDPVGVACFRLFFWVINIWPFQGLVSVLNTR